MYELIKSRVACQQLLDAALLIRIAQVACPSSRWPTVSGTEHRYSPCTGGNAPRCSALIPSPPTHTTQDTPTLSVLNAMAKEASDVGRIPFVRAPEDTDTALQTISMALRQLHQEFYKTHDAKKRADTRVILPALRCNFPFYQPWYTFCSLVPSVAVCPGSLGDRHRDHPRFLLLFHRRLAGVKMVLTGVVPLNVPQEQAPIVIMARRMGAEVLNEVCRHWESHQRMYCLCRAHVVSLRPVCPGVPGV